MVMVIVLVLLLMVLVLLLLLTRKIRDPIRCLYPALLTVAVAKRGSINIEDAVAVADREVQDLNDEIEEFRRDYDDVPSTPDLRTLRTLKNS